MHPLYLLLVLAMTLGFSILYSSCKEDNTEICDNGIDDDNDGFTDCEDANCFESNCADKMNNDGDGFTDCNDPDCDGDPNCP